MEYLDNREESLKIKEVLDKKINSKKFGLRNGYVYSHVILKIRFELFITTKSIRIKKSKSNLEDFEIEYIEKLLTKISPDFRYDVYGGDKHMYSSWLLDISELSYDDVAELLKSIDDRLF